LSIITIYKNKEKNILRNQKYHSIIFLYLNIKTSTSLPAHYITK